MHFILDGMLGGLTFGIWTAIVSQKKMEELNNECAKERQSLFLKLERMKEQKPLIQTSVYLTKK